ncbi:MAG: DegT/DnrJ/EryC1/StrS family aminotransferase [Clostridia bacterium]|nr:DegT/DnrJ/EryC1/StrS family aminotransferase [Clostridia bacterium]
MRKPILLSTPTMHEEEMCYIKEAFEKNWVAPLGFNCDNFENEIADFVNRTSPTEHHALCLNSGTAALHLAVKLADVKKGGRVFCSDVTFAAMVNPVVYEGGEPVFIDSERDTWNMSPIALERAFEKYPDTKVVILVHLYGVSAQVDKISEICKKHNAILIEDAAEALSAEYNGQKCGTFGKYGVFSFNGNKIITTSGGGMLICANKQDRDKALFWATQARENAPWYQHEEIGYNYRMSNVVAGIGRGQFKHLDEHKQLKAQIYRRYKDGLADLPIAMNPYTEKCNPNFWLSCMTVNEGCDVNPLTILKKLAENNIESRPVWKPMHMQPVFKEFDFITDGNDNVGEDIFARGLCLPSDIKMTEEDQNCVIEIIKSCF